MTIGNARVFTISTMSYYTPQKKRKLNFGSAMSPLTGSSKSSAYTRDGFIVQSGDGARLFGSRKSKPRNKKSSILNSIINQTCPTLNFKREFHGGALVNGVSDVSYKGGFYDAGKIAIQFMHGVVSKAVNATQTVEDDTTVAPRTYASGVYTSLGVTSHCGMTFSEIMNKLENEGSGTTYPAVIRGALDYNPFGTPLYYKGGTYTHTFTNESAKVLQFQFTEYTPLEDKLITDALNSPNACYDRDNVINTTSYNSEYGAGHGFYNEIFPKRSALGTKDQRKNFSQGGNFMRANYKMLSKKKVELKPGAKIEYTINIPPINLSNARWKNKIHVGVEPAGLVQGDFAGEYEASFKPNALAGVTKFLVVTVQSEIGRNNLSVASGTGATLTYEPTTDTEFTSVGRGGSMFTHTCVEQLSAMYYMTPKQNIRIQTYDLDTSNVDVHTVEQAMAVDDVVVGPKNDTEEDTAASTNRLR